MTNAYLFKVLQRQNKFRNPKHLTALPTDLMYTAEQLSSAQEYIERLSRLNINWTYPGDVFYPKAFYKMKEPPLFLEYQGHPFWCEYQFISVVGSRQISPLTEAWLKKHLPGFINGSRLGTVSGGAFGVDQLVHSLSLKHERPTIFVLPSGLENVYPSNLKKFKTAPYAMLSCFLTEFELGQRIHKSHFYFRNRLIAALGEMTLVAQATLKSGSLLTVHHCLDIGRPVLTIPSHPEICGFEGNLKLVSEGAYSVSNSEQLLDFWKAESWSSAIENSRP
ncbi:MAG: DNA-processing protein DprA [Bdellovibrio sp.]|nr:DNA-processing protein DprA [Bdellovibrio sp.]